MKHGSALGHPRQPHRWCDGVIVYLASIVDCQPGHRVFIDLRSTISSLLGSRPDKRSTSHQSTPHVKSITLHALHRTWHERATNPLTLLRRHNFRLFSYNPAWNPRMQTEHDLQQSLLTRPHLCQVSSVELHLVWVQPGLSWSQDHIATGVAIPISIVVSLLCRPYIILFHISRWRYCHFQCICTSHCHNLYNSRDAIKSSFPRLAASGSIQRHFCRCGPIKLHYCHFEAMKATAMSTQSFGSSLFLGWSMREFRAHANLLKDALLKTMIAMSLGTSLLSSQIIWILVQALLSDEGPSLSLLQVLVGVGSLLLC